jgi:hypothetical protein
MHLKLYRVTFDVPKKVYVLGKDSRDAEREARSWVEEVDALPSLADSSDLAYDELTPEERAASPAGDPYGLSLEDWARGVTEVTWPWPTLGLQRDDAGSLLARQRVLDDVAQILNRRRYGEEAELLWIEEDGQVYLFATNGYAALLMPASAPPDRGKRAGGMEKVFRAPRGPGGYVTVKALDRLLTERAPLLVLSGGRPLGIGGGIGGERSVLVFDGITGCGVSVHLLALVVGALAKRHGDDTVEILTRAMTPGQLWQFFFRGAEWMSTIAPVLLYERTPDCSMVLHETAAAAMAAEEAL